MPDSLCADEFVGQLLNIVRLATQQDHLKAGIVIEMRMEGRYDHVMMFMLKIGQFFGEKASVMVVDQRHASYDGSIRRHDGRAHKPIPDQVAECLGSVVVAFFSDELVKTLE